MRAVMGGNGRYWAGVLAAAAICGTARDRPLPPVTAQSREVLLATTTSTRDAGLLDSLVPVFERTSGYTVKVIAVGSRSCARTQEPASRAARQIGRAHV